MNRKNQSNQKITALYCRLSLEDSGENERIAKDLSRLGLYAYRQAAYGG